MGREAFIRASIILAACSLDGAKSQRTVACPNSVGEVGYVDITSLNEDMHDEFENITVGGKAPSPPYDYILCPGTVFDGNEILRPVLNQAQFFCGDRGISRTCTISGGTQQVIIADSTDPTYQIDVINFFGVAFSDFTESSISAFAGKGTSTSFNECTWKNWNLQSTAAIDAVYSPDPAAAGMTILLTNCSIASATGGVAIRNAYSEVIINRLDVSNSTIITLLETMNSGFSRVDNLVVTSSSMTAVTLTTSKGQLDIRSSMIFDNVEISDMLISQDNGTLMIIDSLEILNNTRNPEAWNGVFVNSSSTAMITNSHFEGNSNMESAVTSSVFGETTITDTKISSNIGTFPSVSALAFAISDAFITLKRVSLLDNSNYTSAIFAIFRSDATFTETCIVGGNSSSVIFIGEGCSYSLDASTNYIFDQNSSACNSFGTRLFKEDGNSNCFVGSSTGGPSNCTGTCREAATATLCINDGTAAPVATSTSLSPSKSPSTMGITIAPVTPLTPAPVTPLTPAPVTPLTPAPVTPLTPAPVTPLTPAPVTPLTPVPVTPLTPAPLTPLTPAPVTPLTPAPVTVTTPSPLVAPSIYPLAAPTLPSPTAYSLVAKLKSPTTPGSKEGTIKKGASKKRKSKKGKSKKGKSKKRKNKKGKNKKKFKKDGKGGKGKGGKGETQNISGARDINTGITNGHGNVKEDGVSALPSYFKRIHGSRLPTA